MSNRITKTVTIVTLVKGEERYVFIFAEEYRTEMLRRIGVMAADASLSLTWYDAAVISQRIRDSVKES